MGNTKLFSTLGKRWLGETKLRKKKAVTEANMIIMRKPQAKKKCTFPFILGSSLVMSTVNAFHSSPSGHDT